MYLKLENFCCWESKEFEFPDAGSVLISAPSGSGKTSIMRAIMFALFGVGEKIIRYGKKSCSVELQLHDLHIFRSKGPGRLIVNHVHEDESGQHIINSHFDNDLFYLQQHGKKNFISMNSNDKLEYLERILFRHIPLQQLKNELKLRTKELETLHATKKTEWNMIQNMLSELPVYENTPSFSEEEYNNLKESVEQTQARYDECLQKEHTYHTLQQRMETVQARIESEQSKRAQSQKERDEYNEKLQSLEFHIDELEECRDDLRQIENLEAYKTQKKEYVEQQRIYEDSISTEQELLNEQLEELTQQLASLTYDSLTPYKERIEKCKQQLHSHHEYQRWIREKTQVSPPTEHPLSEEEVQELRQVYDDARRQLDEMTACYQCPKCHVSLKIHKNALTEHCVRMDKETCKRAVQDAKTALTKHEENARAWQQYHDRIKLIDKKLQSCTECDVDAVQHNLDMLEKESEHLHTILIRKKDTEKQLQHVVKKYETLQQHIQKLYKKCKELKAKCGKKTFSEEEKEDVRTRLVELQTHAKNHEMYSEKYTYYKGVCERIEKDCSVLQKEYAELYARVGEISFDDGDKEELRTVLHEQKARLEEMTALKHQYQTYLLYSKYVKEKEEVEREVKEREKELQAAYLMKQKILDAEGMALTNLIYTINTTVQMYLDIFFEKEPMQVLLKSYKQMKDKKKSQITIDVNYKGHEVELSCLSGGEYDRVVLSFALTFADLIQSPLLLLDECVSSLDQDTADIVYNGMKQHCQNKLVILVAHQIVTGMFDSILRLKS